MNIDSYQHFMKAFSNKTRLQIIALLQLGPKNVSQICRALDLEQSRISHNLKCLTQCGFVDVVPNGKERVYMLDKHTIKPLLSIMDKHIHKYEARLNECRVIKI